MYDALFNHIELKSSQKLTDDERDVITAAFHQKRIRKRQYFLQEGDVCKYIGFIVKGSARTFTVDEKGHEHILKLSLENWWLADFESFYLLTPSRFNIEALEDLEVLQSTNAQIEEYLKHIPAFSAMQNVI